MQNKKTLLQRLLVIYITFFIVILASMAHNFPNFFKGFSQGTEMSNDIVKSWESGTPQMIYMVNNVGIENGPKLEVDQAGKNSNMKINGTVDRITLSVEQPAPDSSIAGLAFKSIGGSAWLYLLVMIVSVSYLVIIILMFLIINSLRRTIKEEGTLQKRNVWLLRTIGLLTIFAEICQSVTDWSMSRKAAELLVNTQYTVDASFQFSYTVIIMGILILFAAEVFAIGHNLSEEQKFTI